MAKQLFFCEGLVDLNFFLLNKYMFNIKIKITKYFFRIYFQ
jgi:hypothetical protein